MKYVPLPVTPKAGAWKASILRIFNDEMMSIRLVIDRYEIRAIEGAL